VKGPDLIRWCKLNSILLLWLCVVCTMGMFALADLAGWY
jgi:hypothetical protein